MAYEIKFGETGFDIMEDGRVHSTGYSLRSHARHAIREAEKAEQLLAYARRELRKLCDRMEDDGFSRALVTQVLGEEKNWRDSARERP